MSSQNEDESIISNEDKPISNVSHKRRVHFPSDESQLRTISVTPEPLSNQPLYSLGVILQRYRSACQRLQIRPLNCLLDQLSTIDDKRKSFNDRLDCLRIINERIDLKHIDAMEEIFSRCRFHTLDFDSSFSDDLALVQLFDVIEYYESCIHLNLSNNRSIGIQGYQGLTRYLRKTRYLERLDMNSMRFDDTSMLSFGRALRMSSTLYELHLESCQLNGKILQKLIQNLRACVCLRQLYLCDNRLQVQDSILINELIRSCGQFLHLLDLRANPLQDNGLSHIASQLSQYDENHRQQNSIYKISFQSNQLTYQGIGFLAKSLLHNRTIRSLNLSHNPITNEGLYLLRDALLTNRTINELILRNCRLTDQAAIALAEYIAESSIIQYIDLRENNIQVSGICGIAIAMKTNKSLLKFDIDPIISPSTNLNHNKINIDRTATTTPTPQTSSLLSLTNLRRMTVGLGGFTSGITNNSNGTSGDQNNTRDLFDQKLKWLNDIECLCQRNLLLYEAQQQRQSQQINNNNNENGVSNGTSQEESSITAPNDIDLEEEEEKSTDNNPSNDHLFSLSADDDETFESHTEKNGEQIPISTDDNLQSTDILINNNKNDDNGIEQATHLSTNGNDEVEPMTTNNIEPSSNDDNQEILSTNLNDDQSKLPNSSSSLSDLIEDNVDNNNNEGDDNDSKRKIHHSDSLHLLRKKVQHEDDNTSDDESQLSSIVEASPQQQQHEEQTIDNA